MFGYVKTDLPNMYVKDTVLYKACYCGLCKSIGCVCGQRGRFALNYDLTFLSIFAHNVLGEDIQVNKERCAVHWITKRPVAKTDELTKRIASLNLILAYYKLRDDILDEKKGSGKSLFFSKACKKARKSQPVFDEIVKKHYSNLITLENNKCSSIDIVADSFGCMMQDIIKELLEEKADQSVIDLAYSLGKWIYLIDALDDFDKDKKKSNYNVFALEYPKVNTKQELLEFHGKEIVQIFGNVLNDLAEKNRNIQYNFNHDLIDNVLYKGLFAQTKMVMENKKCKKTTKS